LLCIAAADDDDDDDDDDVHALMLRSADVGKLLLVMYSRLAVANVQEYCADASRTATMIIMTADHSTAGRAVFKLRLKIQQGEHFMP